MAQSVVDTTNDSNSTDNTQTIIIWGQQAKKTRRISINGESDISTLLTSITTPTLHDLSFFDEDGIRFGDVHSHTKVKQVGHFDRNK